MNDKMTPSSIMVTNNKAKQGSNGRVATNSKIEGGVIGRMVI
jgi:hypothetical protein